MVGLFGVARGFRTASWVVLLSTVTVLSLQGCARGGEDVVMAHDAGTVRDASLFDAPPVTPPDGGALDSGSRCAAPSTECLGTCVNTSSDPAHCGRCSASCPAGQSCTGGVCGTGTPCLSPDETRCGGLCVLLGTDENNCGSCGRRCTFGESCMAGVCLEGCEPGMTDCSGTCADLETAPAHCGGCGMACPAGTPCTAGECGCGSLTLCGTSCRNTMTDRLNCGGCGMACPSGQVCMASACVAAPPEDCDNAADDDGDGMTDCADSECMGTPACPVRCSGLATLMGPSGTLTDGSGTMNYGNNQSCQWRITEPGATAIQLDFSAFATESGSDFVTVYRGTSATAPQVGRFSGTTIPGRVTATGESMFVTFSSDFIATAQGFTAAYTARTTPVELCANAADEDSDGAIDCADSDCAGDEACAPVRCSGVVDRVATMGTIQDGSGTATYSNNADCGWRVTVAGAMSVQLDFREFAVESGYDFVRVYQGTSTSGTLVGTYTGTTLPPRVFVNGPSMYVRFQSDSSGNAQGFKADYLGRTTPLETCGNGSDDDSDGAIDCADSDCAANEACAPVRCMGVVDRSATMGTIQDGSGTAQYVGNADCGWRITVPGASSMQLDFREFATEAGYDFVRVYQGTSATGTLVGTYSGTTLPPRVFANGNSMYVRFTSDSGGNAQGFKADYTARTTPLETCTNGADDDSDGTIDCADSDCAASEACSPVRCSGTVTRTATTGTIQDGSGTATYGTNLDCGWQINVPGSASVQLDVTQLATEAGYDWVTVYEGTGTSGRQIARVSGSTLPPRLFANGPSMFVRFQSDSGGVAQGFLATYTGRTQPAEVCTNGVDEDGDGGVDCSDALDCAWSEACTPLPCSGIVDRTAPTGRVQDGSGGSNYTSNSDCGWRVQVPGASSVRLTFSAFATENNYDWVSVYSGTSAVVANRVGRFSGTALPAAVMVSGNAMFVTFTSDSGGNAQGFVADYTSMP